MGDTPGAAADARRRVREAGASGYTAEAGVAAAGWLLHALADQPSAPEALELRRQLANRVTETAGAATITTSYGDGSHLLLHSDRRSDAVVLEALIQADPDSDLVSKLDRGLLDHRAAAAVGRVGLEGRGPASSIFLPPWHFRWFEYQNLRVDRAAAFASLLRAGAHEYTFLTRVTSLGTFIAPPARAEEMYAPDTFGRGTQDRVFIE
jgi:hypothetical protein